jgi:SOS-response transcriptional repressor LexA
MNHSALPELSEPQLEVYQAIARLIGIRGYSPTIAEVARVSNRSITSTKLLIDRLIRKGYVLQTPRHARSLRLAEVKQ